MRATAGRPSRCCSRSIRATGRRRPAATRYWATYGTLRPPGKTAATSTLRCARELGDLDRALALATLAGSGDVGALRWACDLRDLLAGHRAEAEALNDHERGALARVFDDILPSRSGARRRRG
jgi:hypothetical protein